MAQPGSEQELSLSEMMRVMDVASELRRERQVVERVLAIDEMKERLRERLLAAARVAGEPLTPSEVDAAVEQYYANLHAYREPKRSLSWLLAHAYIRRGRIAFLALAGVGVGLVSWQLLS
jgi:hypothetical protein